ncbi:MAG: hypothetical protein AB7Q29_12790 [Vicinamibacterales bacterium]
MSESYKDLTLQLTRDLSRLNAERLLRLEEIEQQTRGALRGIPAARTAFERFDAVSTDATRDCDESIAEARASYDAAVTSAGSARSEELMAGERKYVVAGRRADDERRDEIAKAQAVLQSRLDAIAKTVGLDKQFAEREAAREAYRNASAAIEAAARDRQRKDRDAQQTDRTVALDRERQALIKAAAARDTRVSAAEAKRDAAIARAQEALARALESMPEAERIQAADREQRTAVEERYRRSDQELFVTFRAKLKASGEAT